VTDMESGAPVKSAYVALMSGATIIASGYTGANGDIVFKNIDKGSYTISVTAKGYHDFTPQSIDVEPPSVWYKVKIAPIPTIPLPWWLVPVVVGTVVLGGGAVAYTMLKKPAAPTPPVIVMR